MCSHACFSDTHTHTHLLRAQTGRGSCAASYVVLDGWDPQRAAADTRRRLLLRPAWLEDCYNEVGGAGGGCVYLYLCMWSCCLCYTLYTYPSTPPHLAPQRRLILPPRPAHAWRLDLTPTTTSATAASATTAAASASASAVDMYGVPLYERLDDEDVRMLLERHVLATPAPLLLQAPPPAPPPPLHHHHQQRRQHQHQHPSEKPRLPYRRATVAPPAAVAAAGNGGGGGRVESYAGLKQRLAVAAALGPRQLFTLRQQQQQQLRRCPDGIGDGIGAVTGGGSGLRDCVTMRDVVVWVQRQLEAGGAPVGAPPPPPPGGGGGGGVGGGGGGGGRGVSGCGRIRRSSRCWWRRRRRRPRRRAVTAADVSVAAAAAAAASGGTAAGWVGCLRGRTCCCWTCRSNSWRRRRRKQRRT